MPVIKENQISSKNGSNFVLITGGTGYIGSHVAVDLIEKGFNVILFDNLHNSSKAKWPLFIHGDLRNAADVAAVFDKYGIDHVIHLGGLKYVNESFSLSELYHIVNVEGTRNLLAAMQYYGCTSIVFSSSAAVYSPSKCRLKETDPKGPISPYGQSKLKAEKLIQQACKQSRLLATIFRYFNPIGAHPSGRLGDHPTGSSRNLLAAIHDVLVGSSTHLAVYGRDLPSSPDGTPIRDYFHVSQVAAAHSAAVLRHIKEINANLQNDKNTSSKSSIPGKAESKCKIYNLGSGRGFSVLQIVKTMEKICNLKIPFEIYPTREGDAPWLVADTQLTQREIGWKNSSMDSLELALSDYWKFIQKSRSLFPISPPNRQQGK